MSNDVTNCYQCKHRRTIPGDAHTQCVKPDPEMTGDDYGIRSGWFAYPYNFDPIWKTKDCSNFESKEAVSDSVSQSS